MGKNDPDAPYGRVRRNRASLRSARYVASTRLPRRPRLDLRIYRRGTARIAVGYGDLDATLSVPFDFEIRRTDAFGEGSYFGVYEDGDIVTEMDDDPSSIQPISEITGRVTRPVDVDGDVFLEFGIRPSEFCAFFDGEDTFFTDRTFRWRSSEAPATAVRRRPRHRPRLDPSRS